MVSDLRVIDAHQHFWSIGENGQAWPGPDLKAIYQDFAPEHLRTAVGAIPLHGTVLVQSQPCDADTDWLLKVAAATPEVLGVVGWADMLSSGSDARIMALSAHPKMRGLRPMLQDMPDIDRLLETDCQPALVAMVKEQIVFDALIRPRQLETMRAFAAQWTDLSIVIDHGAKPKFDTDTMDTWRTDLRRIARCPNVSCKLSGLLTELPDPRRMEAAEAAIIFLLDTFGPERVLWGSDWPVVTLAASYADWFRQALDTVERFDRSAVAHVFFGSAKRIYRL